MALTTRPVERRGADRIEQELLARLGLGSDANRAEIADAYDTLIEFLETAPRDLRDWAEGQKGRADEAYALLSDQAALALHGATGAPTARPASAKLPVRPTPTAEEMADDEELPEELLETEGAGMPAPKRRPARAAAAVVGTGTRPAVRAKAAPSIRGNRLVKRAVIGVGALAIVAVVAVVGYNAGAPRVPGVSGTPAPEASAGATVDQAQVAALMQKISANPKDTASLLQLANLYFDASDYKTAAEFMGQVVAIDPNNVDGLVGFGAAQFNTGDAASAKANWEKATQLNPKNQEAWFDLGFLYLNQSPADMVNVRLNWNKVIEIDPTTALASSVKTHLDAFDKASPSAAAAAPSGAASAAPAGAAPAASPAASGN